MKRTFLDWEKPCIPTLAEYLLDQCRLGDSNFFDLSGYVLVFPNRAASKRFLTVLSDHAWKNQWTIEPPRVRHMGDFLELLYEQKMPFASVLTQQVVWMQAIRETAENAPELFAAMYPNAPEADALTDWLQLGMEMTEYFQELVRESLDFGTVWEICSSLTEGEDAESGRTFLPASEVRRWEFLAQVEKSYFRRLTALGFWDRQAARLFALRHAERNPGGVPSKDFQISFRLGVVGCVDLNRIQREFLAQVSGNTEIFIFAPESMADRFEEDGCLKSGKWRELDPELNRKLFKVLTQTAKPEDQVQCVMDWLRKIAPHTHIEDVTLGLADESLEPLLLQSLSLAQVPNARSGKKLLSSLQPWKLLQRMNEYFQSILAFMPGRPLPELMETAGPDYKTLALFLRQEDIGNYLRELRDPEGEPVISGDWIVELDRFFNEFYPDRMPHPGSMEKYREKFPVLCAVYGICHQMLTELSREYVNFHSLLTIVTQFLKRIYCWRSVYDSQNEADYQIIRGCMELNHVFAEKLHLPQTLLADLPLTLPEALDLLLVQTEMKQTASASLPGTISIQRWLDLPLDDAGAMAVMGLNDAFVPESITEHIFLPNQLRKKLKIKTNSARLERDIYNLSAILASRKDVCVTLGRISADGRTLFPSRLLLTEKTDLLIDQVMELFGDPKASEAEDGGAERSEGPDGRSAVRGTLFQTPPIPESLPPVREMAVTAFSTFIANPYLFYLQRILRLDQVNDAARELNALEFGILFHDIMEAFGREETAARLEAGKTLEETSREMHSRLQDPEELEKETDRIQDRFFALLDRYSFGKYGPYVLPVVNIQCGQLRERLAVLAKRQAEQYRAGWVIFDVERSIRTFLREDAGRGGVLILGTVEPSPMTIHGKLDRIDFRVSSEGRGEWVVWDYKTFDKTPNKTHFRRKYVPDPITAEHWHDLQLPLYLHLIRSAVRSGEECFADLAGIDTFRLKTGYILVPKKAEEAKFIEAEWTSEVFRSAEERIREIAALVHDKKLENNGEFSFRDRGTLTEWILNPN